MTNKKRIETLEELYKDINKEEISWWTNQILLSLDYVIRELKEKG